MSYYLLHGLHLLKYLVNLDEIRGAWRAAREEMEKKKAEAAPLLPESPYRMPDQTGETGELVIPDDADFYAQLSAVGLVVRFQDQNEREWFRGRFTVFEKVFRVPMAVDLARDALMTSLRIRRMDAEENRKVAAMPSWMGSKDWADFMKLRQGLQSDHQQQMTDLDKKVSWAGLESGKMTFQNTVDAITKAIIGATALFAFNHRPALLPAVVTHGVAQGQQRVDVRICPMHPRAFQPVFDHQFVGALHHPTANRPALRDKLRVLQLCLACFQIR